MTSEKPSGVNPVPSSNFTKPPVVKKKKQEEYVEKLWKKIQDGVMREVEKHRKNP